MGRGRPSQACCSFLLVGEADPPPRRPRHAAPPVARCACASGPGSREPPALAGAGSLRAVCGSVSSPQTPSSAPDGRRAPLARAAAAFRRRQNVSSLPACGISGQDGRGSSRRWREAKPDSATLEGSPRLSSTEQGAVQSSEGPSTAKRSAPRAGPGGLARGPSLESPGARALQGRRSGRNSGREDLGRRQGQERSHRADAGQ